MNIMHLLFSFQGRTRRLHYWMGGIGAGVAIGVIASILLSMAGFAQGVPNPAILGVIGILYLVEIWIGLALGVKRCHDRDKTGWFLLISLIPLIGALWLFVELGFLDGTQGPNRYGPSPKAIGVDVAAPVA